MSSMFERIDPNYQCGICKSLLDKPMALGNKNSEKFSRICKHSFCEKCFRQWKPQHKEGNFTCPTCKKSFTELRFDTLKALSIDLYVRGIQVNFEPNRREERAPISSAFENRAITALTSGSTSSSNPGTFSSSAFAISYKNRIASVTKKTQSSISLTPPQSASSHMHENARSQGCFGRCIKIVANIITSPDFFAAGGILVAAYISPVYGISGGTAYLLGRITR